jgi:hypothetical protein
MDGPSGVLALVLAETAAGGTAFMWLGGLWGKVKRGFFILTGSVVLACALLSALAASAAGSGDAARLATALMLAAAGLQLICLAALLLRLGRTGVAAGGLTVLAAGAGLVAFARVADPSFTAALLQLLAGAAFMGAVMDGLLLGHWYLIDRRLPRDHIQRLALLLLVTVALEAAAVGALAFRGEAPSGLRFSPLLAIADLDAWLALGMVAATGLIAALIRASLRSPRARAVQAATGFFYLAVIFAFTAEMAAKIRFVG